MFVSALWLALPGFVLAVNDWDTPCFSGYCEYHSGDGLDAAFGALAITGPTNKISDVTEAAGWHILECDPLSRASQEIRLVCGDDNNPETSGCNHLFQGGAANTIIRLPDSCGAGPFARVVRTWDAEDQSIPESIASKLTKREGTNVMAMKFDFNFKAIPADSEPVSLALAATNIPGQGTTPASLKRAFGELNRRSARNLDRHGRSIDHRRSLGRRGFISDIIDKLKNLTKFDKSFSNKLPPVNVAQNFPLFDHAISCPAVGPIPAIQADFNVNVDATLNAVVTYGYVVTGTVVPPKIDDFALYSSLNADTSAIFNIKASAKAAADSGVIDLFRVGLPGLDFPGIITLGPSFSIGAQVKAQLGVSGEMKVGAKYTLPKVELVFPPKQGSSEAEANCNESPLKLSIDSATEAVTGSVEAHLIPKVDLGATILGGLGTAVVFLSVDVYGKLGVEVKFTQDFKPGASPNKTVAGCVDMDTGVAITAGAHGALKPFFDQTVAVDLFRKDFNLFHRCLGGAMKRDTTPIDPYPKFYYKRAIDLACPTNITSIATIVDEILKPQ